MTDIGVWERLCTVATMGGSILALAQQSRFSVSDLRDPTRFPKSDYIELLYRVMLRREPDNSGLRGYLSREDTQNFFREILSSREFKAISRSTAYFSGNPNARKRILLFGAYGNGNLGDAIQAMSLLRAIRRIRNDVEIWACSQLPCQFPFPFEYVLPSNQIHNVSLLNQFDLIIIGGGGLLSHPHDPLTNEEWQRAIDVPVVLFGIGAGGEVASKCHTLISKAVYVSGRDESSVAALERFRNDVHFVPDPVLADFHYFLNDADNSTHRVAPVNKLWILKNAQSGTSRELMQMVDPEQDEICFIEPFLDFPLLDIYPAARPIYFIKELITLIDRAAMIISMRYHGCILAILRDKPILGLSEQKSRELLTRYDLSDFFSDGGTIIPDPGEFTRPVDKIVRERDLFTRELSSVLSLVSIVAPTEIATRMEMV